MIKINKENYALTISFVRISESYKKETINLVSEEKTVYAALDENEEFYDQVQEVVRKIIKEYQMNLNFDFDSLQSIFKNVNQVQLFNSMYGIIGFEGYQLKNYKTVDSQTYSYNIKTKMDCTKLEKNALIKSKYVNYARELQQTPPNIGTSEFYAKKIQADCASIKNLNVSILGQSEIEALNMGLLLAVNQGSIVPAQVVVIQYCSDASLSKTVLVGKGITFDSGGYNLKPSLAMKGMKFDMSGAGIIVATIMAMAEANVKANVAVVALFTDNRIGHKSVFPESVVTSMSGRSVLIEDTDAEGRLVLADGLTYAIKQLKADCLIDVSTLTGTVVYALGHSATGVFTHNEEMVNQIFNYGNLTNEVFWRMPIFKKHLRQIQKDALGYADLNSCAKVKYEDCSYAAAFLNEFAENKPYLHLDIAGTADIENKPQGVLVKTLFEMLQK